MIDVFKIVGIAIVGCVCSMILKNTQSQYAMLSTLATGIIILIIALASFSKVILSFQAIIDKSQQCVVFHALKDNRYRIYNRIFPKRMRRYAVRKHWQKGVVCRQDSDIFVGFADNRKSYQYHHGDTVI